MNKNLFKTFAIAAMAVLAGACAKEQVGSADGETVEMTFNVDVPETTITTKGLSDSKDVNEVICQVFLSSDHTLLESKTVDYVGGKANVSFSLVKGQKYDFAFWAQVKGTDYYNTSNLSAVKIDYSKAKANDAERVAFFCVQTKKQASATTGEATLKRAFAQVNFGGILDTTRPDAIKGVSQSKITMTNLSSTIDLFKAKTKAGYSGNVEKVTFAKNTVISNEKLNVNGVDYQYFATAYVPAPFETKILTDAVATLTLDNGRTLDVKAPNVPIKQNFKTNILGNFFNDVEYGWTITIDDSFSDEPGFIYDPLSDGLSNGATITLSEDYKVSKRDWHGINIPAGKESVLNLNGHRFANEDNGYTADAKSALVVKGKLTINGDGDVFCEGNTTEKQNVEKQPSNTCISVLEGGHLIINGGSYSVGTDFPGKCNSTIYVENVGKAGKVEIYGGTFTNAQGLNGHSFVLNQDDQLTEKCITVYGGTFIGFNPADNESDGPHTNYVAEGYKSVKISESPETWQVVDASKTISDQAGLNSALGEASTGDYLKLPAGTYTLPELTKSVEGVTFEGKLGADGNPLTVIDLASVAYTPSDNGRPYNDVTFKNIQFKTWPKDATYKGFRHSGNLLFEGCTFTGIHYSYGNETYKKCKFIQEEVEYNMWVYGGTIVDYIDCTFEGKGKFLHLYNEGNPHITVNIQGCKFISTASDKPAINIKGTCGATILAYTVNIDNCTVSGAFPEINGGLWQVDKPATAENNKITVNVKGKKVY